MKFLHNLDSSVQFVQLKFEINIFDSLETIKVIIKKLLLIAEISTVP